METIDIDFCLEDYIDCYNMFNARSDDWEFLQLLLGGATHKVSQN